MCEAVKILPRLLLQAWLSFAQCHVSADFAVLGVVRASGMLEGVCHPFNSEAMEANMSLSQR